MPPCDCCTPKTNKAYWVRWIAIGFCTGVAANPYSNKSDLDDPYHMEWCVTKAFELWDELERRLDEE